MFCINCGFKLPDSAKFCNRCGAPVKSKIPAVETPVAEAPAMETPVVETPVVETPVVETPVVEAPVVETPVQQPVYQAPVQPVYQPPVYQPPVYQQPMQQPPVQQPASKAKKGKVVVAIVVVLALLLAGLGGWFGYGYISDSKAYEAAMELYEEGEYAQALKTFEELNFKDSEEMAEKCRERLWPAGNDQPPVTQPPAPTEGPVIQVPDVDLSVTEAQVIYDLNEEDVEAFYGMLEHAERTAMESTDSDEVDALFETVDELYSGLEDQLSAATILHYCDVNDSEAAQVYLDATDIVTEANDAYLQSLRRIYRSECAHKDVIFDDWTDSEMEMLERYTDEIVTLEQRIAEIEVEYQAMQDSTTKYDDMVPLYIELVAGYNRIAQIYGYENFYDFAYEVRYERDYGAEEVEQMRSHVSRYLVPALDGALEQALSAQGEMKFGEQVNFSNILFSHYTAVEEEFKGYLLSLPEGARDDMADMFHGNILLRQKSEGAMEGAFTSTLSGEDCICFFGPGYSNVFTVVHEAGHYYGSKHMDLDEQPLDLAETHSQGNEWLFLSYLTTQKSRALSDAMLANTMYENMATILICVLVDEFEQRVYTHPNVEELTGDDLDAIMADVCQAYGGIDHINSICDIQNYWRMVVVDQPVYYLSYAVSAVAAMDIYNIAAEDYQTAVDSYCRLVEEGDKELGFLGNIANAGLRGPFDEEVYKALYEMFG